MLSFSSSGEAPGRLKYTAILPLPGNSLASLTDIGVAVLPSTSGWLPAMNRPTEPSSAGICVVWMYWLSSRMSWSRLSSRSLGTWPLPVAEAICSFTSAMFLARLLILVTLFLSCSLTVFSMS